MGKKYTVLLLVCLVVVAGVGVGVEAEEYTDLQKDCFSHCWHGCFFPTSFCNVWCSAACKYPINMDSLEDDVKYPVPTKEDYLRATALSPQSPNNI